MLTSIFSRQQRFTQASAFPLSSHFYLSVYIAVLQVKDYEDRNYNPSISFDTAFHKPPAARPAGFFRKPTRANSVKLPKRGANCTSLLREPNTVDKLSRRLFPLAYALYLSIYFAVYFFADI